MAKKATKKVKKPVKAKPKKVKKPKKLPIYAGVRIESIGEKKILNRYSTNEKVFYHCRFVDRSYKMVPEKVLKGFIKK